MKNFNHFIGDNYFVEVKLPSFQTILL